jgi:hypothetical protein
MPARPAFVDQLLTRPLPPLRPAHLGDFTNPPYSTSIRAQIADAGVHPALESVLHLLNDDLFSAHFLLRKMQEDKWCKYLHGILHAREGDILNAKCWFRDTPDDVLSLIYGQDAPQVEASHWLDRFTLATGKDPVRTRQDTEDAELVVNRAYNESELEVIAQEDLQEPVRKHLWFELTKMLNHLENMYGWAKVDGTTAYTKDSQALKDQNRILGEGWRSF